MKQFEETSKYLERILGYIHWTIVNKVDTIYKEKCQVQLLRVVPSTILLFHLVSSFRENYAVRSEERRVGKEC